ncbi:hypothetical protein KM043_016297 [Ampulex compressa]|nr:hypothetical protein KM043_016297 [Ampulex compressa]
MRQKEHDRLRIAERHQSEIAGISRRLKSFQYKLQSIKIEAQQEKPNPSSHNTTLLISLSDSDNEIEVILTETPEDAAAGSRKSDQPVQKLKVTSEATVLTSKSMIPPQIIQQMSHGWISITSVKSAVPIAEFWRAIGPV